MMSDGWNQMTHRQGRALARFLQELRVDWDADGVMHYLSKSRDLGSAPQLAVAAILAASSAKNRTPAVIEHQAAKHWQQVAGLYTSVETPAQLRNEPRCMTCNRSRTACEAAAALTDDDHRFQPLPDPRSLRDHAGRRLNHGTPMPPGLLEQTRQAINNKEISE